MWLHVIVTISAPHTGNARSEFTRTGSGSLPETGAPVNVLALTALVLSGAGGALALRQHRRVTR